MILASLTLTLSLLVACTGTTGQQVRAQRATTTSTTTTTAPVPDCAETLPATAKAGQLLMVTVLTPDLATKALETGIVGGFGVKGVQPKNVQEKIKSATEHAPIQPFVASDEEGGTVQRLANAIRTLPSAAEMASGSTPAKSGSSGSGTKADGTSESAAKTMGDYALKMHELGFNMLFGPVADVGSGAGLGTRSFSDEPTVTASFVSAITKAVQDAGLIAVVKYWPGTGGSSSKSHDKLLTLAPIDELRGKDLLPFQEAFKAGAKGVMVAHAVIPGLTQAAEPATMSRAALVDELRGSERFTGLVITDSLGLEAVNATMPQDEAAEKAIAAGADIVLVSGADALPKVHQRLTEAIASGRIPAKQVNESVRRVLAAKGLSGPCPDLVATMTRLEADVTTTSSVTDSSIADGKATTTAVPAGKVTTTTKVRAATTTTAKATTTSARPTTTAKATTTTVKATTTSAEVTTSVP